jgi:hypothetical protein
MQTPHTYRAQAEICVRQAEHAKTPQHRMTLLSMAQTWLRMADEAEAINKNLKLVGDDLDKAS